MNSTTQSRQFFEQVFNDGMYHEYDHVIYARDYNIALNHDIDTCATYILITLIQENT